MTDKTTEENQNAIILLLRCTRPRQWTKNLIAYTPAIFAGQITDSATFIATTACFFALCLASAAVYIINDLLDLKSDKLHPTKKQRPIASGAVSPKLAAVLACLLGMLSLVIAYFIRPSLTLAIITYLIVSLFYSTTFKHLPIMDVLAISFNFVLRACAGALAANVPVSGWFLLCTSFGALFLAIEKRRYELKLLGKDAAAHRKSLDHYTPDLINRMEALIVSTLVASYAMYGFLSIHGQWMMLTIPFVVYGVMRYQNLSAMGALTGNPEEILLKDRVIQVTILLWLITCLLIVYGLLPAVTSSIIESVDKLRL